MDPIATLPEEFCSVESILARMPMKTLSGEPGLLAESRLGETVLRELPDLTDRIEEYKDDLPLVNALYRDYSFLASAYLLEPCHERLLRGEPYGLARDVLPAQIARPEPFAETPCHRANSSIETLPFQKASTQAHRFPGLKVRMRLRQESKIWQRR